MHAGYCSKSTWLRPLAACVQGGLIFWADLLGAEYVARRLREFATLVGPQQAGFFEPCAYLDNAARSGTKLEAGVSSKSKL